MEVESEPLLRVPIQNPTMLTDACLRNPDEPAHLSGMIKEDEWIPYLTISYTIEKVGTKFKKTEKLLAMTADDGPHYANNVALMGDGDYRLTYRFEPPSKAGFIRHVDNESGVPEWWQPFTESWTFHYPSKAAD
jgi:uncharacterized protein involved in high-affinity Fe2+ transport